MADLEIEEDVWIPKLYMVSRADLPAGVQACQAMHAMREFAKDFPEKEKKWFEESNHVAFLSTPNREDLQLFIMLAKTNNIACSVFHEPDLDNELTAACFEPTEDARDLLNCLPLALKDFKEKKRWF